jgi:hypothetical protein
VNRSSWCAASGPSSVRRIGGVESSISRRRTSASTRESGSRLPV